MDQTSDLINRCQHLLMDIEEYKTETLDPKEKGAVIYYLESTMYKMKKLRKELSQ